MSEKEMTLEKAHAIIDLWNKVPPKDSLEHDGRWVALNQCIGFIAGHAAGFALAKKMAGEIVRSSFKVIQGDRFRELEIYKGYGAIAEEIESLTPPEVKR